MQLQHRYLKIPLEFVGGNGKQLFIIQICLKTNFSFWDLTKVKIKDITIEIAEKLKTDESEIKCWEKDLENLLIKKDTLENENKINTLKSNINTYYR